MTTQEKWIAAAFGQDGVHAWAMQGVQPYAQGFLHNGAEPAQSNGADSMLSALPEDWIQPGQTRVLACGLAGAPFRPVPANPASLHPVPPPPARRNLICSPCPA